MKKKNIIQIFASNTWGGGELFVFDLTNCLIENNYKVVCILRKSKVISQKIKCKDIEYYQLKLKGVFDFLSALKLKRIVQKHNIDIIHTHNFKTSITAVYAKMFLNKDIKIIVSRHLVKKAKTDFIHNWLYKHIDYILFVSDLALEEFLLTKPKIDKTKLRVIHNSVIPNPSQANTIGIRESLSVSEQTQIVLFTGRIHKEKGLDVLIESIYNLKDKDFVLLIAGDGKEDYKAELKEKINQLGLKDKVFFMGFLTNVSPIIKESDFGVCPSIGRESFGLSVVEFMLNGKAVITTNNGAQKEYIKDKETGILIQPNNVKELTNSIELLMTNKVLRESIGQKGKEYFDKELSYEQFYKKITTIYNNV
jgi:glycosyltransferase involved in cell wall biosynthesis